MGSLRTCACAAGALALVLGCAKPKDAHLTLSLEGAPAVTERLVVDFGAVQADGTYTRWVTLRNEGGKPATVLGWAGESAPGGIVAEPFGADPALPLTVAPGRSHTLWLRFAPDEKTRTWGAQLTLLVDGVPDAEAPTLVLAGRTLPRPCNLSLSEPAIDFGLVPGDEEPWRTLVLRNESRDPFDTCAISNLRLEPGGDPRLSFAREPLAFETLGARELTVVTFKAVPGEPPVADAAATFAFEVVGAGTETVRVPIAARFPTDCLDIEPEAVDFGASACGATATTTVPIRNRCDDPLELTDIRLAEEFPAPSWDCPECVELEISAAPEAKTVLEAGQATTVELAYQTRSYVKIDTRLELRTLTGKQPAFTSIPIRAEGSLPRKLDEYGVPKRPVHDILVVVDDGPSMSSKAERIESNLNHFFDVVRRYGCADANVGVLSTDTSDPQTAGVLVGPSGDKVLNRIAEPSDFSAAQQRVLLPTNTTSSATPLEAIRLALSSPLVGGANAGFLRPGVDLSIVIVTDRADASPLALADYQSFLGALNPKVYVAAGFDNVACGATPDDGRLEAIATETSDLCDASWPMFGWGGWGCADYERTSYFLTDRPARPYEQAIRIAVDGIPFPAVDSTTLRWWFDPPSNAVQLAKPLPGGVVAEFDYAVSCY